MAASSSSQTARTADLGRPKSFVESQLPGQAVNSRGRPHAVDQQRRTNVGCRLNRGLHDPRVTAAMGDGHTSLQNGVR
jgi:hypothetical protein